MGFSSALQGQSSHEALLARQDAEIRLLENMKRCLSLRIKADRDYTVGLNSFVLQAQKQQVDAGNSELVGSMVGKAWTVFIEESEKIVKMIKENAEGMATNTMEKLNSLYAEKKANRKQYHDESSRISTELHRLQEAVQKTRSDYEKCLESYAAAKVKYEEQFTKGKQGKRFDDVKERYQKVCRKLHLTHNEYVLLLCEASEFERDMRTILLPGLLEHQQAIQEDMIEKWKIVLQEVQMYSNTTDRKWLETHNKISESVSDVKSGEEYKRFIDLNKTAPPPSVTFKFDPNLAESTGGLNTHLTPKAVILDDLTIDSLKQKLSDNESKLSECKSQIKDKQTLIIQYETELGTVKFKSDPISVTRMFAVKKVADVLKKEVNELRCTEQKLIKQNELMQVPLSDLGCEQAPTGCDLSNNSSGTSAANDPGSNALSSLDMDPSTSQSQTSLNKGRRSVQMINMLKNPFGSVGTNKRNNNPAISGGNNNFSGSALSIGGSRQDLGGDVSESSTSLTTALTSVGGGGGGGAAHTLDNNFNNQGTTGVASHTSMLEQQQIQNEINRNNPGSTMSFESGRNLEEELWFHGVLPRGEVVRLLEMDGDFLVRETTRNDEKQIVLSVMWTSPKHFIVQTSPEGLFRFEGPAFGTVQELIIHQFQSGASVTGRSGAVLKTPILREKWELNNDDVELLEKIGRGNFGDVYRATLQNGHGLVAVKTCKTTLPDEQKKKFLQEGRILKQYDHPNIVKFIGICVQKQPIMIVMELVPGGSLLNFLRNHGANLTQKNLLGMCLDASAGMQYLESKNCIHRDLAARNCLVGEGNQVKISDFGMSREEEEYTVSDGLKQIPIKWTAPEALNYGKYTSLCDVWSYGVLSWEIFSRGGTPYQGMTNTRAREMLDSGYRMPAPEGIPEEMYQHMLRCWNYEPEDRPHFPEIHQQVELLFSRALSIMEI